MNNSAIEWTDTTWNPVTGCSKVSQGCKNCYAERIFARPYPGRDFTDVRTHTDRLDQPLRRRKPKRIFVNSMSDLFHEDVPDAFILQVFDVMRECQNGYSRRTDKLTAGHTFQILTKRADRMRDFCIRLRFAQNDDRGLYLADTLPHNGFNPMPALKNIWLGVSVEDQETATERIPLLLKTPAAVRFISAEPLLGPISFEGMFATDIINDGTNALEALDLVITGGESGPNARPSHPDWFRLLRDQCTVCETAFFFKQWGEWKPTHTISRADEYRGALVDPIGGLNDSDDALPRRTVGMDRVGKKAAGRTLDGREHSELPTCRD